jgi:hypothetical protein
VTGAILYLPTGTAVPAGFTKIGTSVLPYAALNGKPKLLKVDLFQKD